MKLRTIRRGHLRRYLGPDDYDGYPCNIVMVNRATDKSTRAKARAARMPPHWGTKPAIGVTYDKRTGRETQPPAWERRLADPRTWPKEMRIEAVWDDADIREFQRYWAELDRRTMGSMSIPPELLVEPFPGYVLPGAS